MDPLTDRVFGQKVLTTVHCSPCSMSDTYLYVENLPHGKSKNNIRSLFNNSAEIKEIVFEGESSAKVCFRTAQAASALMMEARYKFVSIGQERRVIYVTRHGLPCLSDPECAISLKNLPKDKHEKEIHRVIEANQVPVAVVKLKRNPQGESVGVATVICETREGAAKLLDMKGSLNLGSQDLVIEKGFLGSVLRVPKNAMVTQATEDAAAKEEAAKYGPVHSVIPLQSGRRLALFTQRPTDVPSEAAIMPREEIGVLQLLERRTVVVTTSETIDERAFAQHMGTAGKVVFIDFPSGAAQHAPAVVQYETEEEASNALKVLDRTSYTGKQFIKIVGYLDGKLDHSNLGVLQVNELPSSTRVGELLGQFQKYGRVVAATITASWYGDLIGFLLFENWSEAQKAAGGTRNVFLWPAVDAKSIASAFHETDKMPSRCLVCYGLPQAITYQQLTRDFDSMKATSIWMSSDKTAYLYFESRDDAIMSYNHARSLYPRSTFDLLNNNIRIRENFLLKHLPLPAEWRNFVFLASGVTDVTNKVIYSAIEEGLHAPVIAAFNRLNLDNGSSMGQAMVILRPTTDSSIQGDIELAQRHGLSIAGKQCKFAPFKGLTFASMPGALKFPDLPRDPRDFIPRAYLKEFVRLNIPSPERQTEIIAKIDCLCAQDVSRYCSNMQSFIPWIGL